MFLFLFFFNDTATTEIYTLSLHDALPISRARNVAKLQAQCREFVTIRDNESPHVCVQLVFPQACAGAGRSEEHTSELQSQSNLVCRLLLEKKKQISLP